MTRDQLNEIRKIDIAFARRDLWKFCELSYPDFFTDDKWYLKEVAEELANPTSTVLLISIPPRHGKTMLIHCYRCWKLGKSPRNRFITGSFNDDSAVGMSKQDQSLILRERTEPDEIVYADIFPNVQMTKGDAGAKRWSIVGGFSNMVYTGRGGTVTGKGASEIIIDDPIKDAEEAFNALTLEKAWLWVNGTLLSRMEASARLVIPATRWSDLDPQGMLLALDPKMEITKVMAYPAMDERGKMLCPAVLPEKDYWFKKKAMDEVIFLANYHNMLIRLKGALYKEFKTYTELPEHSEVLSYCDFANSGADFLCEINAALVDGFLYVRNVVYCDEGVDVTEDMVVNSYNDSFVTSGKIEAQNGGDVFAMGVQKRVKAAIEAFHQSGNKDSRINQNQKRVQERVLFPEGWQDRWPVFYFALMTYIRNGKNKHDDAPDALTGLVEMSDEGVVFG